MEENKVEYLWKRNDALAISHAEGKMPYTPLLDEDQFHHRS